MIFPATEPVARMIADARREARREALAEVLVVCARLAEEAEAKDRNLRKTRNPLHDKQATTQFGKSLGIRSVAAEIQAMMPKEQP